jgi:hypothetical protein
LIRHLGSALAASRSQSHVALIFEGYLSFSKDSEQETFAI